MQNPEVLRKLIFIDDGHHDRCQCDRKLIRIAMEPVPERNVLRVSVFNTGKRIPEEDLENLWQKFYKVDKARTRAYGGSGIGLSIVKAIMDLHGMAYGVENLDDGVRFWFETALA